MADSYNPVQTVAPQIASPDNSLSVRANPNAFGAQIGEATSKLGSAASEIGQQQTDIAIQRQGMINETAIANGETQLNTQYGALEGQYKALKGQAYVGSHDEYVSKLQQVRQDVLKTLPNDASRRGFNVLAARAEGFVIRDAGLYRGTQIKQADTEAAGALIEQTVEQASKYGIASDDSQLGYILGTAKDTAQHIVINQGWDLSTKDGQTVFNKYYDEVKGKIFDNAVKTLAEDPEHGDPIAAVAFLEQHKDVIPAITYARLSQQLAPQYRSVQARTGASEVIRKTDDDYTRDVTTVTPLPPLAGTKDTEQLTVQKGIPFKNQEGALDLPAVTDKFIQQESGFTGKNLGQIQPGTWKAYAHPGEEIDNPIDNRNVTQRILQDYSRRYNGDLARVAVAYFSGPGNVAPAGSATPWVNDMPDKTGKSVSQYVSDITGQQTQTLPGQTNVPMYKTKAEYYEQNYGKIIQSARDWSQQHFPNDTRMEAETVSRAEQHISEVIKTENEKKAYSNEVVRRFVFGEQNNGQLISNIDQLENGPSEVKDAWHRMEIDNPLGAEALRNKVLTANSRGKSLEYGTDFWKHYEDIVSGKISDISQLYNYVGSNKNSPLTNTGLTALAREFQISRTPEGAAFLQSEKQYFEKMRSEIVGGLSSHNAQGEAVFRRAMMQALPKIQAGRSAGKSAGDLFDEDSPDYVGGAESYDGRPLTNKIQATSPFIPANQITSQPDKFDIKSLDTVKDAPTGIKQLQDAISKKQMTRQQAIDYSHQRGWTIPQATVKAAQ